MTKALRLTIAALAHERCFDIFEPNIHITHGRVSEMLSKVMSILMLPQNLRHCARQPTLLLYHRAVDRKHLPTTTPTRFGLYTQTWQLQQGRD
jgi:hypothetical protein